MNIRILLQLVLGLVVAAIAISAEPQNAKPKQFLGILRLVERLHSDSAWTTEDRAAVQRHFQRLKDEAKNRKVIFAGRTAEPGDKTMGLVVFEAANLHEAEKFMAADPAVLAGVMKAETRPYQIAVARD